MPKSIVICCDGTGDAFSGDWNSNVVKLYSTLVINETQVGYFQPGVGTMGAPNARNWVEKQWSRVKGLTFGAGFISNVADAYRYLMSVYADGGPFTCSASAGVRTPYARSRASSTCTASFVPATTD
jgi:uncharacterized protein (DUF2235 family)